jgi:hypothetical protein
VLSEERQKDGGWRAAGLGVFLCVTESMKAFSPCTLQKYAICAPFSSTLKHTPSSKYFLVFFLLPIITLKTPNDTF